MEVFLELLIPQLYLRRSVDQRHIYIVQVEHYAPQMKHLMRVLEH